MTSKHKERLTLEQLRAEQVYIELTSKQKVLVDTFIQTNGDRTASVLAAYATKSKENAQIMAYTVLSSPRVVACLSAYFQSDPLEDFKAEVRKAYRNRKLSVAQVDALKLHAELNGWSAETLQGLYKSKVSTAPEISKPQPVAQATADVPIFPPRFQVGETCYQDGKPYRVLTIDENGQPSAVDEIE